MKKTVLWILVVAVCLFFIQSIKVEADVCGSAKAAVIINADTKGRLYSKNAEEKLPMASTTKIMTALLLCENANLEDTVTVTKQMVEVEGSSMGLLEGDTVSYHDLLYGLLLASGNDAANTVAISLCSSVEAFVEKMNKRAAELGLLNTHFVTPSGLDADGHYTTAYDLACLAAYALKNDVFLEACSSRTATLCYGNPPYRRSLKNHNKLLDSYEGLIGVKTGYTKKSGRCLVTAVRRDGKTVIAVTLNDPNDWQDHTAMLDYGLSALECKQPHSPLVQNMIDVVGSTKNKVGIAAILPQLSLSNKEWQALEYEIYVLPFIYAPNGKNQPVGQIRYILNDELLACADIVLTENVTANNEKISFIAKTLKAFLFILKQM